jgi:hypothetical protein
MLIMKLQWKNDTLRTEPRAILGSFFMEYIHDICRWIIYWRWWALYVNENTAKYMYSCVYFAEIMFVYMRYVDNSSQNIIM